MPLVYQQDINDYARLAVWKTEEPESFFADKIGFITNINHPQKRKQFLAGRYLLKQLAPFLDIHSLLINASGKPFDPSGSIHFSVSHCGDMVAVIVNNKYPVGVDIQFPEEKLAAVSHKFLSQQDMNVLSNLSIPEITKICFGWSLKESLFKWYGESSVNFIQHLLIEEVVHLENAFRFQCQVLKNQYCQLMAEAIMVGEYVLTYTIS